MSSLVDRMRNWFRASAVASEPDPLDYDKLIHLDAEDLAEQGMLSAYLNLRAVLAQYTDSISELAEEIDTDAAAYSVEAAGRKYVIWEAGPSNKDGWERATVAFFDIVNANLVGRSHKFYALYGGNDLSGMFLTTEECAAARRALANRASWPWLPVNDPPGYGYPAASAA